MKKQDQERQLASAIFEATGFPCRAILNQGVWEIVVYRKEPQYTRLVSSVGTHEFYEIPEIHQVTRPYHFDVNSLCDEIKAKWGDA